MRVLITGTSGFIGRALAADMAADHEVVCLSRQPTEVAGVEVVVGDFTRGEDLHRLDRWDFDALVHLGAVTGAGAEADLMRVNVMGTYDLLRYLIDRGCSKFALASSIAAVGMQSVHFRPLELPMSDEHPCLDRDGYGFSKYMMEETTRYLARQREDLDFINIRLASIWPEDRVPAPRQLGPCGTVGDGGDFVHVFERCGAVLPAGGGKRAQGGGADFKRSGDAGMCGLYGAGVDADLVWGGCGED